MALMGHSYCFLPLVSPHEIQAIYFRHHQRRRMRLIAYMETSRARGRQRRRERSSEESEDGVARMTV